MEYPKIETLLNRDEKFKVIPVAWRLPEFAYLKDNRWLYTEKVDGTNVRVHWDGKVVTFGGRSDTAQMPTFLLTRLQELFTPMRLISTFPPHSMVSRQIREDAPIDEAAPAVRPYTEVTLFGEGYGAKIQKGGGNYKPDGVDFVLFDVLVGRLWLSFGNVINVAVKLGIQVVPVVELTAALGGLDGAIIMARAGIKSAWGDFPAEGLVVRPLVDLWTRKGERLIGKIKTKDFLRREDALHS